MVRINKLWAFVFCISIAGTNASKNVTKGKEIERKMTKKVLPNSHLYAVIIAGSPEQYRHWNGVSAIYSAFCYIL